MERQDYVFLRNALPDKVSRNTVLGQVLFYPEFAIAQANIDSDVFDALPILLSELEPHVMPSPFIHDEDILYFRLGLAVG